MNKPPSQDQRIMQELLSLLPLNQSLDDLIEDEDEFQCSFLHNFLIKKTSAEKIEIMASNINHDSETSGCLIRITKPFGLKIQRYYLILKDRMPNPTYFIYNEQGKNTYGRSVFPKEYLKADEYLLAEYVLAQSLLGNL